MGDQPVRQRPAGRVLGGVADRAEEHIHRPALIVRGAGDAPAGDPARLVAAGGQRSERRGRGLEDRPGPVGEPVGPLLNAAADPATAQRSLRTTGPSAAGQRTADAAATVSSPAAAIASTPRAGRRAGRAMG